MKADGVTLADMVREFAAERGNKPFTSKECLAELDTADDAEVLYATIGNLYRAGDLVRQKSIGNSFIYLAKAHAQEGFKIHADQKANGKKTENMPAPPAPDIPSFIHALQPARNERGARITAEKQPEPAILDAAAKKTANSIQIGGDHYKASIETWDYILAHGLGYLEGNIVKYVTRHKKKNGLEDLRKARHYLDKLIEYESDNASGNKPPLTGD